MDTFLSAYKWKDRNVEAISIKDSEASSIQKRCLKEPKYRKVEKASFIWTDEY